MDVTLILIGLLLTGLGAVLLGLGLKGYGKDRTKLFIQRCTKTANGVVDGFDNTKVLKRKTRDYYYYEKYQRTKIITTSYYAPVIVFSDNNVEYRATYFRPMEKAMNKGEKVVVQYNPENPYEYIIKGDKYLRTNSRSSQSTGLGLLVLGIVLTLYGFGIIHL